MPGCLETILDVIALEAAVEKILATIPPPIRECIPLADAHNRVLVEASLSSVDLPAFDNSAMDGYAVRARDVDAARLASPVRLRLRGRVAAGETFTGEVVPGECVRLFTGSPLPGGADAVVMQEDTRVDPAKPNEILICDTVNQGENIRRRGSDVTRGTVLAEAGGILTAARMSLLSAAGIAEIEAGQRPRVGLLATGSELREAGQTLAAGQIYESNRIALAALVRSASGIPQSFPLVSDELTATQRALEQAFNECDVVVTSGGASVGEMDFVKSAFEQLGGELQFWKVAIRPGKPFVFGCSQGKFLFGLPGNPVSAFVTFLLLVRPALLRWQGAAELALPVQHGVLGEPLANPADRRHFMRVRVDTGGKVFSAGAQASHALRPLAAANGLVDVPSQKTLPAGTTVPVMRWE